MTSIGDTLNEKEQIYGDFGRLAQILHSFKKVQTACVSITVQTPVAK